MPFEWQRGCVYKFIWRKRSDRRRRIAASNTGPLNLAVFRNELFLGRSFLRGRPWASEQMPLPPIVAPAYDRQFHEPIAGSDESVCDGLLGYAANPRGLNL